MTKPCQHLRVTVVELFMSSKLLCISCHTPMVWVRDHAADPWRLEPVEE
jgi:hypothetical protein